MTRDKEAKTDSASPAPQRPAQPRPRALAAGAKPAGLQPLPSLTPRQETAKAAPPRAPKLAQTPAPANPKAGPNKAGINRAAVNMTGPGKVGPGKVGPNKTGQSISGPNKPGQPMAGPTKAASPPSPTPAPPRVQAPLPAQSQTPQQPTASLPSGAAPPTSAASPQPRQTQDKPLQPAPSAPGAATAPAAKPPAPQPKPEVFRAGPIDVPSATSLRLFSAFTRGSFIALVLLPLIASALYLLLLSADRYAVEVKFAIRSPNGFASTDLVGLVTGGAAGGATQTDSYMVVDYLESRQFLDEIIKQVDLPAMFGTTAADPLMRLSPDASAEDKIAYLPGVIDAYFDATSQIITVETQAFNPQDAQTLATAVLSITGEMINETSEQARRDTVRLAEEEVTRAETALREQRRLIAAFREAEQKIDPQTTVATQESVLSRLQIDLANETAEMNRLLAFLSPDSPTIRVLQSRITSIRDQIAAERGRLGTGTTASNDLTQAEIGPVATLNTAVSAYEELVVDLDFRQRAYVSALGSLEAARLEADRQQRYLAAFVLPSLPESPTYPRVLLTLVMVATVSFLIWGTLSLFVHILREHLQ